MFKSTIETLIQMFNIFIETLILLRDSFISIGFCLMLLVILPFLFIRDLLIMIPCIDYYLGVIKIRKLNGKLTQEKKDMIKQLLTNGNAFAKISPKNQLKLTRELNKLHIKEDFEMKESDININKCKR